SRRRHTRSYGDWSSDVCSSDLSSLPTPCDAVKQFRDESVKILCRDPILCPILLKTNSTTPQGSIRVSRPRTLHSSPRKCPPVRQIGRASCREREYAAEWA